MGKGRAPCCDKTKVRSGPWSPTEDLKLIDFIQNHGHSNWRALPKQAGLLRCGKSCRLRWINYLRPDVKRGNFTPQEEQTIINLHNSIGNKWSKIASYLPGRTDNEIKNIWNTHLKKRLKNKSTNNQTDTKNETNDSKPNNTTLAFPSPASNSITSFEHQNTIKVLVDQKTQESKPVKSNQRSNPDNSSQSSHASNFFGSNDISSKSSKLDNNKNTNGEKFEIPLDSDIDFWELFDSLDKNQEISNNSSQEKFEEDIECSKWFRLLENELVLTCDFDNALKDQDNISITLEPETGPGLDYFPIWPCSPQNLGI